MPEATTTYAPTHGKIMAVQFLTRINKAAFPHMKLLLKPPPPSTFGSHTYATPTYTVAPSNPRESELERKHT